VGLVLLVGLVFLVYFLGEHAGSQSSTRSEKVQKVIQAKADLERSKTDLNATTTPPGLLFVAVGLVIVLILMLFGRWDDGDHYYHRHRH
jgi:hypothetical protein